MDILLASAKVGVWAWFGIKTAKAIYKLYKPFFSKKTRKTKSKFSSGKVQKKKKNAKVSPRSRPVRGSKRPKGDIEPVLLVKQEKDIQNTLSEKTGEEDVEASKEKRGVVRNIVEAMIDSIIEVKAGEAKGDYMDEKAMEKCILSDLKLLVHEDLEDELLDEKY